MPQNGLYPNVFGAAASAGAGIRARSAFDEALVSIEEMAARDVVNLPQRPEPQQNPFANPLVMVGMALQGRSAEAIAASSRIDQFNRQREDEYRTQVLQAHNYRQLRQQRFATTLAELQQRAATAQLSAESDARQSAESARRFDVQTEQGKADAAAEQRRHDEQMAFRQMQFDAANAEGKLVADADKIYANDPQFKLFNMRREALATGEVVSLAPDGSLVTESLDTMDPAARARALSDLRSQMAFGLNRYYGQAPTYVTKQLDFYKSFFDALERVESEAAKAQDEAGASNEPTTANRLGEARDMLAFQNLDARPGRDFDFGTSRGVQNFVETFESTLDDDEALSLLQPLAEGRLLSPQERLAAGNMQAVQVGERLETGMAQNPRYLQTKEGKSALLTLAREMAQQVVAGGSELRDVAKAVRERLKLEYGIKPGYVNDESIARVVRAVLRDTAASRNTDLRGRP